ncbi:ABC transporter permease [Micromonospora sp. NPDC047467]|uniref:ABC transporter permease n=1 Tax=Micromonospora sp. NPDC047467 TaxID=3154814 RepID=UPI0033D589A4
MSAETAPSNSTDRRRAGISGYGFAASVAVRDYISLYPPSIVLLTILPRVLLQVAFISYLGYYAGGTDGRTFAFIGAALHIMTTATVAKGADAILDERVHGTMYRIRLGVLSVPGTVAARWLVYAAEGFCASLAAILVLSIPFGGTDLLLELLPVTPLIALLALTTSAFGMAVGSFALSYRADVLIVNLATYAMLLLCGVVAPTHVFTVFGWDLPRALPLTNGVLAVRAAVDGQPWLLAAFWEVVVGIAWAAVAVALLARQDFRARHRGTDDFL